MGAILGLLLAGGVLLVVMSQVGEQRPGRSMSKASALDRMARNSGIPRLTGIRLAGLCAMVAVFNGVVTLLVTALPVVALIAAGASSLIPVVLIRRRVAARQRLLREQWPDAVDALLSAVRAGLSLPEAVCALASKGPEALRPAFADFSADYRAAGSFNDALRSLGDELADPVADRVIAALSIAREVGGSDLGSVLRALSVLLREDARVRGELEARQSWTVNAARLAIAAPWVTLALLSTRPETVRAYSSATGTVVLLVALGVSLIAYRLMIRIGRLPSESRLAHS
ncbi:MAG: type II secretion system F family protein [Candidatus Nanopelagicales bacterium]